MAEGTVLKVVAEGKCGTWAVAEEKCGRGKFGRREVRQKRSVAEGK